MNFEVDFFNFIYLFIYLFLAVLSLHRSVWAFSSYRGWGLPFRVVQGLLTLVILSRSTGSRHGSQLWLTSSVVAICSLSSCGAQT